MRHSYSYDANDSANFAPLVTAQIQPDAAPTFVLTAATSSFDEGSSDLFTLTTTGVAAGSVYNYAITGLPAQDFPNGQVTGTVTIGADGIAYINVSVLPNVLTASTALTLSVAGVSDTVTVLDTTSSNSGTYTLTNGADNITTPSAGTYTVVGTLGELANGREALGTFSVGDRITGNGANTTLIINQNEINNNGSGTFDLVPIGVQVSNVGTIVIDSVQALGGPVQGTTTYFNLAGSAATNTSFTGVSQVNVNNSSGNDYVSVAGTTSLSLIDVAGSVTTQGGDNVTITTFDGSAPANVTVGGGTLAGTPTGAVSVNDYGTGTVTVTGGTVDTVYATGAVTITGGTTDTVNTTGAVTITGGNTDTVTTSGAVTIDSSTAGAAAGSTAVSVTELGAAAPVTIGTLDPTSAGAYDPSGNVVVTDVNPAGAYNSGLVTIDTDGASSVQVAGGSAGGITDYASYEYGPPYGSLANVSLSGVAGNEVITSNALTNLDVSGSWANLAGNTAVTVQAAVAQALALSLSDDIGLDLTDNSASAVGITTDTSGTGLVLSAEAAKGITVTGTGILTLQGSAGLGSVSTLTILGGAGFSDAGLAGVNAADALANYASLKTIDGSTSTNAITATINSGESFVGGSGVDTVTISADQLAHVNVGTSVASNTLVANAAGATFTAAKTSANVTGYSTLDLTASASGTYDLANVFHAVPTVAITAAPTSAVFLTNPSTTQTLSIDASLGNKSVGLFLKTTGRLLALNLGTAGTSGVDTSNGPGGGVLGTQQLSAEGYVSATVNSNGDGFGTNTVLLRDKSLGLLGGTLTINGDESLTIGSVPVTGTTPGGSGHIAIINVNAAAGTTDDLTKLATSSGGVDLTVGNSSVLFTGYASSIKTDTVTAGSGNNTITELGAGGLALTAANGNNTITSVGGVLNVALGNGTNTVIGNNASALIMEGSGNGDYVSVGTGGTSLSETVSLGGGNNDYVKVGSVGSSSTDTITLGSGYGDTVQAGNGAVHVTVGDGTNDQVSVGNGPDVITAGNGNDAIAVGNGSNTITAGSGADTITIGAGLATPDLGSNIISANVGAASPGGVSISFDGTSNGANSITLGNGKNAIYGGSLAAGNNTVTAGTGANSIALGNGQNTITVGSGTNTLTVGDGNNTLTAGNGKNLISVGNGTNTITAGSGKDSITLGSGQNTVNLAAHSLTDDKITFTSASTSGIDVISGLSHGDTLAFVADGKEVWNGGSAAAAQVIEPVNATFQDFLNAAAYGTLGTPGVFSWFEYQGNTYIVEDRSTAHTFVAGSDLVLELKGNQSSLILGSTLNGTAHTLGF